jgi:hypothetical protein
MPFDELGDGEFVVGVEAAMALGHILPQEAISADHRQFAAQRRLAGMIDDQQMVADGVEAVLVALRQHGSGVRDRRTVLVEHLVAQLLRALDVALLAREANLERADATERRRRITELDRCGAGEVGQQQAGGGAGIGHHLRDIGLRFPGGELRSGAGAQ